MERPIVSRFWSIETRGRPGVDLPFAYADVEEVRRSEVMESVVAVDWDPFNLRLEDRTEWVGGGLVSASVFATLGLEPIRGRAFLPGEDQPGAAPVVILGERLWRSTFGAREVVGETVWLDGTSYQVIGVAPSAMDIEVRRGRALTETDRYESAEVVVISETFAREFFGSRDPIGARISFSPRPRYVEIVGVVEDTRHVGLDQAARYQIYAPFVQRPTSRLSLVVESRAEAGALAAGLREIVRDLDPDLAISGLTLVEDVVRESVWRLRLLTQVFWAFGIFAVLLAAVGIAGIVAQAVSRRTHEIGVRMALGARAADIMGLVGRRIGWVIAGGLGAGAAAALLLGRLAEGTLYGVHPQDPRTFVAVIAAFALVGAAAAVVPARRAIAIDPAEALRAD